MALGKNCSAYSPKSTAIPNIDYLETWSAKAGGRFDCKRISLSNDTAQRHNNLKTQPRPPVHRMHISFVYLVYSIFFSLLYSPNTHTHQFVLTQGFEPPLKDDDYPVRYLSPHNLSSTSSRLSFANLYPHLHTHTPILLDRWHSLYLCHASFPFRMIMTALILYPLQLPSPSPTVWRTWDDLSLNHMP